MAVVDVATVSGADDSDTADPVNVAPIKRRRRRPNKQCLSVECGKIRKLTREHKIFPDTDSDIRLDQYCKPLFELPTEKLSLETNTNLPHETGETSPRLSLPFLLMERQTRGSSGHRLIRAKIPHHCATVSGWCRWLCCKIDSTIDDLTQPQTRWRPYCQRFLTFRELRTPASDAVLGIDPTGSYLVTLRETCISSSTPPGNDTNHVHPLCSLNRSSLCLCVLGLPSPSAIQKSQTPYLLLTIPLLNESSLMSHCAGTGNNFDVSLGEETFPWESLWVIPAPAWVPVRIWISGSLGVCLYYRGPTDSSLATVVLFTVRSDSRTDSSIQSNTARTDESNVVFLKLDHVPVPCRAHLDSSPTKDNNLLWHVSCIPHSRRKTCNDATSLPWHICDSLAMGRPANLLLIDEGDGYRLTWISDSAWQAFDFQENILLPLWESEDSPCYAGSYLDNDRNSLVVRSTVESRVVVVEPIKEAGWETVTSDRFTGEIKQVEAQTPHLKISFSAFFSVASLFLDILSRRPKLVRPHFDKCTPTTMPEFSYQVVGIDDSGRVVEIFLVFSERSTASSGCIGVFVQVDLFTQDYREIQWIRHKTADMPFTSCGFFALERRRKLLGIATPVANLFRDQGTSKADELLALCYPNCQTMDNLAVRMHKPITSICARSAPVEVTYC